MGGLGKIEINEPAWPRSSQCGSAFYVYSALRAMSKKLPVVAAYTALLVFSLPIPLLHQHLTDKAIETLRPVMRLADGSYAGMLMPIDILLLRWLGQLSWYLVCGVFIFFLLSFRREKFAQFTTISTVAICQCAFTTLYAFYAAFLLGETWLHRAN
jgi:hypothetical protein